MCVLAFLSSNEAEEPADISHICLRIYDITGKLIGANYKSQADDENSPSGTVRGRWNRQ